MNETEIQVDLANLSNSLTLQLLLPVKIILILSTIALNLLIIFIIIFMIKKRTYSNMLFLSKSFADVIVGASSMSFLTIYTCYGYWPLNYGLCVFWIIFDFSSCCISIFNLLLITWHRYRQLTCPYEITEDLTLVSYFKMILVWIIPFAFWIGSVLPITSENFRTEDCYFMSTFTYVILSDSFTYIIPILVLLVLNALTYRALKLKSRRIAHGVINVKTVNTTTIIQPVAITQYETLNNDDSLTTQGKQIRKKDETKKAKKQTKPLNKDHKAVVCLIVVSLLLVICWIIFILTWPIQAACDCVDAVLYEIGYWLAYIYSTLYPISLIIFHENIKRKFISIVNKITKKR